MKKINMIAFAALAVFLITSCKNNLVSKTETKPNIPTTVKAIDVGQDGSTVSLVKETTKQLQAKALPEHAADTGLTYSSKDDNIASVDNTGLITAKEVGETVITIKAANSVNTTIKVTVTEAPVPVTDIAFEEAAPASLVIGDTYKLKMKVQPDDATYKELTYTADNNNASVAPDGTVTAQSEGTVNIIVKSQSNPEVTETVTITIKQKPEIELNIKDVASNSDEEHPAFTVQTLHDKLAYTPEVVGDGKEWLSFDRTDSTSSETEDTVHLKAKPNKTVWDRVAYIKFKDANGRYIKGADGNVLEVKFTQKKNEHPNVTIKWVYGIGEPTQSEKERGKIEVPFAWQAKKFYWDDDKIFFWYETETTKWFNNRKVSLLGISAPEGADGNQCWAKTASNMLHWWFVQNKDNIDRYIQHKSQAEKDKYVHYYKRELPTEREKEKSNIANTFRLQAHNGKLGDYIISGLAWYLYGNPSVALPKIKEKDPAFEGPALFKDVFSKEDTPIKRETVDGQDSFNKIISTALKSEKAIGIDIWGSKGNKDYAHAITLWGAAFDEEENIIAIYVVDNNFAANRIFPYGIWYKEGKPYLFNYGVNQFVQDRYVGQVTTLDKGEELWKEWFDAHP